MKYSKSDFTDHIWTLPDLGKDHVRIYEITKVIKTSIHRSDVESRIQNAHENYSTKYKYNSLQEDLI